MDDNGYGVYKIQSASSPDFAEAMTFVERRGIIVRASMVDSIWSVLLERKYGDVLICRKRGEVVSMGCFYRTQTPAFNHVSYLDGIDHEAARAVAEYLPKSPKEYLIIYGPQAQKHFAALPGINSDRTELYYTASTGSFRPACGGNVIELTHANSDLLVGCEAPIYRAGIGHGDRRWFANIFEDKITATALIGSAITNADRDYEITGIADVYTEKAFRGQGFGSQLVSRLTEMILQTGKKPAYWTTPDNIISRRLIEGLGYTGCGNAACCFANYVSFPQ